MAYDEPEDIRPTACYRGDQITAQFNGRAVKADYGVPGSPVWEEVEDIEIQSLEILGIEVNPSDLPNALQTAIIELSDDLTWET